MPHSHFPSSSPPERATRASHVTLPLREAPKPNRPSRGSWNVATNLFASFRYAWNGISYTFQTQRNFRIHVVLGTVAIGLCAWLKLPLETLAIVTMLVGAILVLELLNTAIEAVVDLCVGQRYHDLAKIAKDCAAGAVLLAAIVAVLVACVLILPTLLLRVLSWF